MKIPYPLVEVEWLDANRGTDWSWLDDVEHELTTVVSVGRLIYEDRDVITLAPHIGNPDSANAQSVGHIAISKACITKRRILRKKSR